MLQSVITSTWKIFEETLQYIRRGIQVIQYPVLMLSGQWTVNRLYSQKSLHLLSSLKVV